MSFSEDTAIEIIQGLGYVMIERIGGGNAGVVWLLDDGSVVKVTKSPWEVAVGLALRERLERGGVPPGIPEVYDVYRVEGTGERLQDGTRPPLWVVRRENMTPFCQGLDDPTRQTLKWAIEMVPWQRSLENDVKNLAAAAFKSEFGDEPPGWAMSGLIQLCDSLRSLQTEQGIVPRDIILSNVGVCRGAAGLLDLGGCLIDQEYLDRAIYDPSIAEHALNVDPDGNSASIMRI